MAGYAVPEVAVCPPMGSQQSFVATPGGGLAGTGMQSYGGGSVVGGSYNSSTGAMVAGPGIGFKAGGGPTVAVAGSNTSMAVGGATMGGVGGVGGGTPVAVPPGDPCGCGPGASAGDCAGSCGGAEVMCCEPAGGVASVQWVQTGMGGAYAPVTNYQYVGEGAGGWERQVVTSWYGWRVRKCCLGLLCCLLLIPLLYLLMNLMTPGEEPPVATLPPAPEVLPPTPAPVGPAQTCLVFGDPHVKTFDGRRSDYYTSGEYWIVRSSTVQIQGRYLPTQMTKELAVTKELAIGGSFIGSHKLIISVDHVFWDGEPVMEGFEKFGQWRNANPPITIVYNSQGTVMQTSREGKALHVLHITLPGSVVIEVNRWAVPSEGKYINSRITMQAQPGQDGHCGNFNGNPADDSRVSVRDRVGRTGVPENQLLFPGPKTPVNPGNRPDLNDCPEGELKIAEEKCKAAEKSFFPSQGCLVDACLGHIGPNAV